jgi:signal transduction histidine kinase
MLMRLKKQLINRFVLSPGIIFFFAGMIFLLSGDMKPTGIALFSAGLLIMIAGFIIIPKMIKPLSRVELAIESLEKGNPLPSEAIAVTENEPLLGSLQRISERIGIQEKELQDEKLRRLRSVIDGQDRERQRLARELHDSLGQSLIAVRLQLESTEKPGISQVRAAIDVSKGMIDQAIDEVRRISNDLQPAALDELGLESALRTRTMELAAIAGITATFECNGSIERLAKKSKIYLFRIAQEAITNTIKHARATEMAASIARNDQTVILTLTDNGKGFMIDPKSYAHRNGIQNMRERASLLGGTFTIESAPKAGTRITVTIPYKRNEGDDKNFTG